MPTGKIDMHMPDRWGYLYFSDKTVGTAKETFSYPYNMGVYKLVWSIFYAQQDYKAKTGKYTDSMEKLGFTASYLQNIQKSLPGNVNVSLEATANTYYLQVAAPFEKATYTADFGRSLWHYGTKIKGRFIYYFPEDRLQGLSSGIFFACQPNLSYK